MTFGPANSNSAYLDVEFDVPKDAPKLREFLVKRERLTASLLNLKEIGQYELTELLNGQQWFNGESSIKKYGYRTTVDLVALNEAEIPVGTTVLTLTGSTIPSQIDGSTIPLPSHGSATTDSGIYLFLNDPQVYVRFNPNTQQITIVNNSGESLSQCYFEINYLKQE